MREMGGVEKGGRWAELLLAIGGDGWRDRQREMGHGGWDRYERGG